MRVLFLSWRDLAHPQAGGSEVLVDRLLRGLQNRGHDVALACAAPVGDRPYQIFSLGGTYSQYLRAPLVGLRAPKPDIVVDVSNGVPFMSPLWYRGPVICLVHHVHKDQWPLRFPRPVAAAGWFVEHTLVPRIYARSSFVVMSESTAAALSQTTGMKRRRITVLPMGVDRVTHVADRSTEPLWVAVGRLVPHKRIELLLRVWSKIGDQVGGRLMIVGDGPERGRLTALAGPGVEFLGHVRESVKRAQISSAWLLLHPSMHEGWGLVISEAAAAGTPTLAFDVPGVRDAVADGLTGRLVQSETEFANAWIRLADHHEERIALGKTAHERSLDQDWETTSDALLDVCNRAIAPRRSVNPS